MDNDKTPNELDHELDNNEELEEESPRRSCLSRIIPALMAAIGIIGYHAYKMHRDNVQREQEQNAMLYNRIHNTVQPEPIDAAVEEALKAQSLRYNSEDDISTSKDDQVSGKDDQTVVTEGAVE